MPEATLSHERRDVLRDSIGVGIATGAYGVGFGAIAVNSGFTVLQACALSLLVFTGASQFAFVGVVASSGAPMSGAATALMLGSQTRSTASSSPRCCTCAGCVGSPRLSW